MVPAVKPDHYHAGMGDVPVWELRQHLGELVRRAQAGERVTITIGGRPAAVLGPAGSRAWRRWDGVADVLGRPLDGDWADDRDLVDNSIMDPWAER